MVSQARWALVGVLVGVLVLGPAQVITAELLNISGVTFTPLFSSTFGGGASPSDASGHEFQGVLLNVQTTLFANMALPDESEVTAFTVHARDIDTTYDVAARLMAKPFATVNTFESRSCWLS